MLSLYGVSLSVNGIYISRSLGAAFLGFGIVSWMVRNSSDSSDLNAIVFAFFISEILVFIISLFYQFQGILKPWAERQ
jgi:hypothetical protein